MNCHPERSEGSAVVFAALSEAEGDLPVFSVVILSAAKDLRLSLHLLLSLFLSCHPDRSESLP
jgi:hypothetical protein